MITVMLERCYLDSCAVGEAGVHEEADVAVWATTL